MFDFIVAGFKRYSLTLVLVLTCNKHHNFIEPVLHCAQNSKVGCSLCENCFQMDTNACN